MKRHPTHQHGFTLAEIIIAMLVVGLVMVAVGSVLRTAMRSWQVGHDMTEIVQTARVTQDVVLRDMHNIVYLADGQYNQNFQRGLQTAAQQYQEDYRENGGVIMLDERFDWESLTPPIDLSFRATDGGALDRLSFVRAHQSRFPGDPNTWGLRRITYYVQEKTLFRSEEDPFGYRQSTMSESFYNPALREPTQALAEYFARPDRGRAAAPEALTPEQLLLPESYQLAEPLCEGVELFNVTVGHFKNGEWLEVNQWDSTAREYRQPPEISEITDPETLRVAMSTFPDRIVYDSRGVPSMIQNRGQPDDLPGYIAMQVGVRGSNGKGRLHSFTFYHSFPMSQERDVLLITDDSVTLPDAEFSPSHGRDRRRGGGRRR